MSADLSSNRSRHRGERYAALFTVFAFPLIIIMAAVMSFGAISGLLFGFTYIVMPFIIYVSRFSRRAEMKLGHPRWLAEFVISILYCTYAVSKIRTEVWAQFSLFSIMFLLFLMICTQWSNTLIKLQQGQDSEQAPELPAE